MAMGAMAATIDWVFLNPANVADVSVGELISADAGCMPIYRVMAIRDGRAWIKDLQDGADRVAPLSAFCWKAEPAAL
jgi:hypothetical protein